MTRTIIWILIPAFYALSLSSCIHVDQRNVKSVSLDQQTNSSMHRLQLGSLQIENFIYTPSKLPLSGFFRRLAAGEFKKALEDFDLEYKPANSDNEAIQKLLDEGLVPVYVRITNLSDGATDVSPEHFHLIGDDTLFVPIRSEDLPKEIERISPAAIGASIVNIAVLTLFLVVIVAAEAKGGSRGKTSFNFRNCCSSEPNTRMGLDQPKPVGPISKVTTIDYNKYLFETSHLAPGETAAGLIFFKVPAMIDREDLKLEAVQR